MEEIWRDIEGYKGKYKVSNFGLFKNLNYKGKGVEHIFEPFYMESNGRMYVTLWNKNKGIPYQISVLLAKAFPEICGEWFEGAVVHHKDENKLNNNLDNLQVMTQEEHRKLHSESEITNKKISEKLKGRIFTEETKNKISNALKGHIPWNKGMPMTEEQKKKLSEINKGKKLSEETKHKMSISRLNGKKSKEVIQFTLDGKYITTYPSVSEAQRQLGLKHISDVCLGKRKTAGGFVFKYKEVA